MNNQRKYIIVVIVTSILIIANQIIIQYALNQVKGDAKIINIAGKQRMLSQRLSALTLEYNVEPQENKKAEIQKIVQEWSYTHKALQKGSDTLDLKPIDLINISRLQELDKNVEFAQNIVLNIEQQAKPQLIELLRSQERFLIEMDFIVKSLEENSRQKLNRIGYLEILLALFALFIIYIEVFFIIRPIINDLSRKNISLKQSNRILEEYAYIASHDLRTPIINILSYLGLIKRKTFASLDDNAKMYFNFIDQSAQQMDQTTKDLLQYSLLDKIEKKQVNLRQLIEQTIQENESQIQQTQAQIIINTIPNQINVDPFHFKEVIKNLLDNSLKFISKEKTPIIEIKAFELNKNTYQFEFKDNGIGIAKQDHKKIFGIFKRLHNATQYKGTGIGLALIKKIIEKHGGEIWVESNLEQGTVFIFTIPK